MSSLFNISGWVNTITYSEDDIVSLNITGRNYYFYSLDDNNSGYNPTGTSSYWSQTFHWKPSYTTNAENAFEPTVNNFGDGYSQRLNNSLDAGQLSFNLNYRNISNKKARAIFHFFEQNNHKPFIFNSSNIYKSAQSYIISDKPRLSHNSYNSWDLFAKITKVYSLGNYIDDIALDPFNTGIIYFLNTGYLEQGTYKIKYKEGAINFNITETPNWWMTWDASTTPEYFIHYGSSSVEISGVGGGGTGTYGSYATEKEAREKMKILSPEKNIIHTSGKIGMRLNSITGDNGTGAIPVRFALYKIG